MTAPPPGDDAALRRHDLERAVARLELVHDIDRAILAAEHPSDIAARAVEQLRRLAGADRVGISAVDLERRVARVLAFAQSGTGGEFASGVELPLDQVVGPGVLERPEPTVYGDLAAVAEALPALRIAVEQGMRAAVIVPLAAGGQLVGLLSIAGRDPAVASGENVAIAREVAAQLAVAIRHAMALDATERSAARLALVHDIDAAILRAETPEAVARAVADRLLELTTADLVAIARDTPAGRSILAMAGADADRVLGGLAGLPVRTARPSVLDPSGAPLVFPDLRDAVAVMPPVRLAVELGMTVGLFVPLVQGGRVMGAVTLTGRDPALVGPDTIAMAREVADQVAVAIVHADARAELERSLAQHRLVHEIDQAILAAESPEALATRVAEPLARLTGARRLDISAYDLERDEGRILAFASDGSRRVTPVGTTYPLRQVVPASALERPEITVLDDLASAEPDVPLVRNAVADGLTHGAWVPLVAGGRLHGAIGLASDDPALVSPASLGIARAMGDQLAVALQGAADRAALAEREGRLRAILEASPNGILTVDRAGVVGYANPAAHRLFGAAPGTLPGIVHARLVPPAHEAEHGGRIRGWFEDPDAAGPHPHSTEARRLDGTTFPVHVLLARVATPSGTQAIATVVDLSDRAELEGRLRQAERLEVLGTFAGILAHDVRNYLSAIAWSADILATDLPADDPRQGDVEMIRKATQDAVDMTRSVLEFARPAGDPRGTVDVAAHLAGARSVLRRVLGEGVRLELDVAPGLPAAGLNPTALTQVLLNLASNARDAMPDGGTLRIEVRSHEVGPGAAALDLGVLAPGGYVRLLVSDTGVGMDEATRARAFDPFYTTKTMASTARGTGLGLSSVFLIITKAGGAIRVDSEPGRGATFTVDLPVAGS